MDVQTENTDPPPNESQPSGKIRKGFKLFGKRKPGNIFSIRSKGDGNNKSPVISSKTLDGLSETPAAHPEPGKENGQEEGQAEKEQAEDDMLGEDGVLASAPARTSISSASSAKSLSFLSLLRGGRRGVGDRRVHTVSQPAGRQRRGLKGLFSSVKLRSKDKDDKEEAPPSPLLMSSRANSVEIIKEDLTLTPKCQPRSLNSPDTDSSDPIQSSTANRSGEMSPSESSPSQETTGNASRTKEHAAHSPTSDPPLVPGDTSLSSLLADISSLLTFDSITGGDIMADVEAEWGKASSAFSSGVTPTSFLSKPASSPPAFTTISMAAPEKPSSAAVSSVTTFTTFAKPSTLTSHSVKLSSGLDSFISIQDTTKPSTTPAASTAVSAPLTSFASKTIYSTSSFTSSPTVPANTLSTTNKAPFICPSKLTSETASPPQSTASVSKPSPTPVSPAVSAKPPPVTQGFSNVYAQPPPVKSDTVCVSSVEKSTFNQTSQMLAAGESTATGPITTPCAATTKPPPSASVNLSKVTTVSTAATTTTFVPTAISKPSLTSTHLDLNKTPPSFVTVSAPGPSSTSTATKAQPSSSTSSDKIPPVTKPTTTPVSLDKMPPPYTAAPSPNTQAASTASQPPTALGQLKISASGVSPAPAQMQTSVSKELPAPTQVEVSQAKAYPTPAEVPLSVSKDPSALIKLQVSSSKAPSSPTEVPISVSKAPPAFAQIPISQPKTHPAPPSAPCRAASPPYPPLSRLSETPASAKVKGPGQASVHQQPTSPDGTGGQGNQAVLSKTKELHNEPQTSLHGPSKEKKPPQSKASGLSKIPVVGGGRVGKLPVRESQHGADESSRDPPTPEQEERPGFNSHDAGSKDKISAAEANAPTSKHTQEESQPLQQPKSLTSSARDSKIPVKHGAQPQSSQTKEPPRTKIPVSKVPVRRAGNKPAATGGTNQMRK
ncbi:APC membrane recruitment protein 2 [Kryptolebias marmoratus]|uniref:APC membrane recruitment protein 2-like n=1 Tax=Kryptolebias marmoratus TaxID=37003 RepID=A0A3Q3GN85_KRYMA|nr:APC membrane recruitment protein 2 [Kryptolebias marmoratus]